MAGSVEEETRLKVAVGTAAMVWVGGGIIVHGLEEYGLAGLGHAIHAAAEAAAHAVPAAGGVVEWLVTAAGSGVVFASYLGGNGDDRGFGIAVDGSGAIYVVGDTPSNNFPTTAGGEPVVEHPEPGGHPPAGDVVLDQPSSLTVSRSSTV